MIFTVFMINKAGSLLFWRDYGGNETPQMSSNDRLRLAGMLHGLSAFTTQLSPVGNDNGLEEFVASTFKLNRLLTSGGMQLVVVTDIQHQQCRTFLKTLYKLYCDYVLKNPSYTLDMPITRSCEKFDQHLKLAVEQST
eukprot:TRINITY_DN2792_c0_g1_i1.p1 TRINITY_DN2792_c0_g1~~TRINITY_DN2792_c0_g1_i1.p1  ORF type:complete len:138 (+),score=20.08 TRINITY_DN2792_c0_g1_i1:97-510(+)